MMGRALRSLTTAIAISVVCYLVCITSSRSNVVMSFVIPSNTIINSNSQQLGRRQGQQQQNLHVSVVSTFESLKQKPNKNDDDDSNEDNNDDQNIVQSKQQQQQQQQKHDTFDEKKKDEIKSIQKQTKRLSRPERKALERAKKQAKAQLLKKGGGSKNNKRKHNFNDRKKVLQSKDDGENGGTYELHSKNGVSKLDPKTTTPDDIMRAIKRAQNLHDVHDIRVIENFLLNEVDETYAYGYKGSLLSRLAVAALHLNNHKLARKAIEVRRREFRSSMVPMESAAIIRGLLRVHNISDAFNILNDELSLPLQGTSLIEPDNVDRVKHRALSLASIVSRCFYEDEPFMAIKACKMLKELGPIVRQSGLNAGKNNDDLLTLNMPWTRIIKGAAQCESKRRFGAFVDYENDLHDDNLLNDEENDIDELPCNFVYSVLNAMTTFPSDNNDLTYEALSNALVRRVLFVTGAVSMDTLPKADRGEVVFIGRSNVGKSSLVNMITNRKSLAYTSKTPGKTQQYNYFAVNDKVGREKEIKYGDVVPGTKDLDSFYIVDVPGYGFAKVSQQQKQQWSDLLSNYITNRGKTLRVIFHLIDSRHGPIDEDVRIMKEMSTSKPKHTDYVIVLTKSDKNIKMSSHSNDLIGSVNIKNKDKRNNIGGKVSMKVMDKLRETMKANKVSNTPVILTSAETKFGRDDIWRYLKRAAEY